MKDNNTPTLFPGLFDTYDSPITDPAPERLSHEVIASAVWDVEDGHLGYHVTAEAGAPSTYARVWLAEALRRSNLELRRREGQWLLTRGTGRNREAVTTTSSETVAACARALFGLVYASINEDPLPYGAGVYAVAVNHKNGGDQDFWDRFAVPLVRSLAETAPVWRTRPVKGVKNFDKDKWRQDYKATQRERRAIAASVIVRQIVAGYGLDSEVTLQDVYEDAAQWVDRQTASMRADEGGFCLSFGEPVFLPPKTYFREHLDYVWGPRRAVRKGDKIERLYTVTSNDPYSPTMRTVNLKAA